MIKKVKKGFTLIELVVVIAVIAILSAVSVVAYVGITNSAKKSAAEQKASQIVTCLRAAALSSSEGYKEQSESTPRYTVEMNGRELKITPADEVSLTEVQIINDMLAELEGADSGLSCDAFETDTDKVSHIGVYKQGGSTTADLVWASF